MKHEDRYNWRETKTVAGTEIKGCIPVAGNGCWHGVGSDSYGYRIFEVAEDGKWFTYGRDNTVMGTAVLVTRKNARHRGSYCMGTVDENGHAHTRGSDFETIGVSDRPGEMKTYLDPSF